MPTVKIHFEWLSTAEQAALRSVVNKAAKGVRDVCVRPFDRFGFSGAKLLLVYFRSNPNGRPFIVKLNSARKIQAEVTACEMVKVHFPADTMVIVEKELGTTASDAMGAVCYLHVAAHHDDQRKKVKDLKEIAFSMCVKSAERKCIRGLEAMYQRMAEAHRNAKRVKLSLDQEYQRPHDYLRLKENRTKGRKGTRALLEGALGSNLKQPQLELFGAQAYNPSIMLDRLLKLELSALVGPIHGDLHTSNVVFTPEGQPRLVDFAWANPQGHVLKDFVLMENSVRFMIFPGNVIHERELEIDQILATEDGGSQLADMSTGNGWADQHFKRLGEMVQVIRAAAKHAAGADWNFTEYLISQYLVLVGALEHYDYNFRESVRALGVIARTLDQKFG